MRGRALKPDGVERLTPSAVRLQLVSPTKALPVRPCWIYEPKLDGCRVVLGKDGPTTQVRVRGGGLVQRNVPEVVASLERLAAGHLVLDGELVVVEENGRTDFDAACSRLRSQHGPPVIVYAFDVLALENAIRPERALGCDLHWQAWAHAAATDDEPKEQPRDWGPSEGQPDWSPRNGPPAATSVPVRGKDKTPNPLLKPWAWLLQ